MTANLLGFVGLGLLMVGTLWMCVWAEWARLSIGQRRRPLAPLRVYRWCLVAMLVLGIVVLTWMT